MPTTIDYFGAYYHCPETFTNPDDLNDYRNGQPILNGTPRLHYIKCANDVFYVRLAKDYLEHDKNGEFACDTTVWTADDETNAIAFVNANSDLSAFHPVTQDILQRDLDANIPREDILESRAGIMMQPFLGFVAAHVFMVRPDLQGTDQITVTTLEGTTETVEVPRFTPASWERYDNPEFL